MVSPASDASLGMVTVSGRLLLLSSLHQVTHRLSILSFTSRIQSEADIVDSIFVSHVQFSHDGKHIVAASPSGTLSHDDWYLCVCVFR